VTFEEYALARGAALVRFARLLTGDEHRAEDLVQDVLAKTYSAWHRIGLLEQPDLYVRKMVVNANTSWWRRAVNRELAVAEPAGTSTVEDTAAESAERDAIWRLVLQLPPRQRTVIVLRYYEDYDDATIAELMRCSTGTVRTHAKRALDKLHAAHLVTTPTGEYR
jgi:RNA polymerase sigma-70 factor (sigma-E family)